MVGREAHLKRFQDSLEENKSSLIAVYGRRRIGKTYIIRNFFSDHIAFDFTGIYGGSQKEQLKAFLSELKKVSPEKFEPVKKFNDWLEAFEGLRKYLETKKTGKRKKVVFLDEFPWLDTHKSNFVSIFGHFWNTYCEVRTDLIVIVCGSASSYMIKRVLRDRGSLYGRLSYSIHLKPFTLYETKKFLQYKGIDLSHYNILHLYIALGGVPHYLDKIKKSESVVQNIERLCFTTNGDLVNEFDEVFSSLFTNAETHQLIIRVLAKSHAGMSRDELIAKTKLSGGGHFTKSLEELVASGFVSEQYAYEKRRKDSLYRLCDEYTRFYLKYIEPNNNQGNQLWSTLSEQSSYISWAGYSFENICFKHIDQIKKALGISGIKSQNSSWRNANAQIDMLISRADNWINLCEIKFSNNPYTISKSEYDKLRNRMFEFKNTALSKRYVVAYAFVSTFGITKNAHAFELVHNDLNMDVLFEP